MILDCQTMKVILIFSNCLVGMFDEWSVKSPDQRHNSLSLSLPASSPVPVFWSLGQRRRQLFRAIQSKGWVGGREGSPQFWEKLKPDQLWFCLTHWQSNTARLPGETLWNHINIWVRLMEASVIRDFNFGQERTHIMKPVDLRSRFNLHKIVAFYGRIVLFKVGS